MEYEDEYSKNQILNQYLNTASYGTNNGKTAVGVEAASQVYFDKDVTDLNVGEAALLAGLPQAPTDYNPFINPKGAKQRRNEVLAAMRDQGYISPATYAKVRQRRGSGCTAASSYEQRSQQYFFDFVQQELIDKYGVATAREGGLKVYTTLDPRLQAVAEQAIAAHPVTGAAEALVSTDVDTGEIKAMASSSSYDVSQFNLAAQGRRQPGSSFKPYALDRRGRPGHRPRLDLLLGRLDSALPGRPLRRPVDRRQRRQRLDEPPRRDRALRQHGLRAARPRHRRPTTMDDMAKKLGVTSPPLRISRPRSSARATSPCSTRPTPTRRSPTAASTTTRPRSPRSSSPTAHVDEPDEGPEATG